LTNGSEAIGMRYVAVNGELALEDGGRLEVVVVKASD
jgi:hypothetical protein